MLPSPSPTAGRQPPDPSGVAAACPQLLSGDYWAEQVREAEHGLLDFVTIADSVKPAGAEQSPGRPDAIMIAARVAPLTRSVGIMPGASTTSTEPFPLSTQIATLDYVSGGRAGPAGTDRRWRGGLLCARRSARR